MSLLGASFPTRNLVVSTGGFPLVLARCVRPTTSNIPALRTAIDAADIKGCPSRCLGLDKSQHNTCQLANIPRSRLLAHQLKPI